MSVQKIAFDVELDDEFFEDILVCALEGGSNWIKSVLGFNPYNVGKPKGTPYSIWLSEAINKGGRIEFVTDDEEKVTLTLGSLTNGVMLWTEKHPKNVELVNENGKQKIDSSNIDADDADAILQYALFGKLVYG